MAFSTFAAIDVGSNEVSMKIYEISKNGIHVLDFVRQTLELGSQTYSNGNISRDRTGQLCTILKDFQRKMKEYHVENFRACATSALREANNQLLVLDQIRLSTGIEVDVLSNSQQRFFSFMALAMKMEEFQEIIEKGTAIADVGSGNIQISLFHKQALVISQNLKLGSLRLRELLGDMENRTDNYNQLLSEYIDHEMETFGKVYLRDVSFGNKGLFSIRNLIGVGDHLKQIMYYLKPEKTDSEIRVVTKEEFERIYHLISHTSIEELSEVHGISKEQASLILPTVMIYQTLFERTRAEVLWTLDMNLCDGIVAEYAGSKGLLQSDHDFTQDIINSARNIAYRYQSNTAHVEFMEKAALAIYEPIAKSHGLGARERLLLRIAVILHDCGEFINMNETRLNSYRIISTTELIGLSDLEREMTARIVAYASNGKENGNNETRLGRRNQLIVAKLSAILELADALDKSHLQKCKRIESDRRENKLVITLYSLQDMTLERELFERNSAVFEDVFGLRIQLKQKKKTI